MSFCIFGFAIATNFQQLANLAKQRYGEQAKQTVLNLESLLIDLQSASEPEQLKRINLFFNTHIKFVSDKSNWGKKDYWATPLESLGIKKGDCEDYSIAKYIFLRELGIPDSRLKLTYVRAKVGGTYSKTFQAHMVLSYYATPTSEPMILDNLISEIHKSSRRIDLTPIFSFNSEGLWAGVSNNTKGSSLKSLSRWSNVLKRIKNDGIK
ncbi:MAG: transglutaminase-like cysteine peptidase [Methylophilaceae bacterium]